jgi:GNAT superfamily N-acetyltransferase
MKTVHTKTTYLQMLEPGACSPASADWPAPTTITRVLEPSLVHYRSLYNGVGSAWNWVDRNLMADEELASILRDERVEVYELQQAGQAIGFAELDRRVPEEVELAYFGLFPTVLGRGFGTAFLRWVVQQAWSTHPQRVWVHTCDLDHPAALATYLKVGFAIYDERMIEQKLES